VTQVILGVHLHLHPCLYARLLLEMRHVRLRSLVCLNITRIYLVNCNIVPFLCFLEHFSAANFGHYARPAAWNWNSLPHELRDVAN